jgi:DNA-binding transcriptional ArsR family regulator
MCDVSAETVRRWLKPLINVNRVRVIREGRSVRYKARGEWAMKTRDNLNAMHDRIERERHNTPDSNLGSLVTVRRLLTRIQREELSAERHG